MKQYESWGQYAALSDYAHQVRTLTWRSENLPSIEKRRDVVYLSWFWGDHDRHQACAGAHL